jgi:hypothetical protein
VNRCIAGSLLLCWSSRVGDAAELVLVISCGFLLCTTASTELSSKGAVCAQKSFDGKRPDAQQWIAAAQLQASGQL